MQTRLARPLPGRRIHFVAIGGVGMAALAELVLRMGYEVSGSDLKDSPTVRRLQGIGIRVAVGVHTADEAAGADHVVVSNAVARANPAVVRARELGLDVLMRAELLGRVFEAGRGVAVAGGAGKTTTSSMLAAALAAAGMDPSYLVGGSPHSSGTGGHLGTTDLVVAEADEAYRSFLLLRPALAVVTNIHHDHHDVYPTRDDVDAAFLEFLANRRDGAPAVLCADDAGVRRILPGVAAPVVTYGFGDADVVAEAGDAWTVKWGSERVGSLSLRLPGRHQVGNALGALTAAGLLGADLSLALQGLAGFAGVDRRFTVRGHCGGVTVVDDYAHHPAKVSTALRAAREAYPRSRVIALFQPHLYSRTQALAEEFGSAFADADVVVVTDVFGAREEPVPGVSGRLVAEAVRRASSRPAVATYVPRLDDAAGFVAGLAEPGDVVLTIGAGDVTRAGPLILELLADAGDPRP